MCVRALYWSWHTKRTQRHADTHTPHTHSHTHTHTLYGNRQNFPEHYNVGYFPKKSMYTCSVKKPNIRPKEPYIRPKLPYIRPTEPYTQSKDHNKVCRFPQEKPIIHYTTLSTHTHTYTHTHQHTHQHTYQAYHRLYHSFHTHTHTHTPTHTPTYTQEMPKIDYMGWLRSVGSLKL